MTTNVICENIDANEYEDTDEEENKKKLDEGQSKDCNWDLDLDLYVDSTVKVQNKTADSCKNMNKVTKFSHYKRSLSDINCSQRFLSGPSSKCYQESISNSNNSDSFTLTPVVRFNLDVSVILEPEDQVEDLRLARISDFNQRQADRERMERLLTPILTTQHRNTVWQRQQQSVLNMNATT